MADSLNPLEQFAVAYTRCPVCCMEFREPKCLPACAHSVCTICLGKIRIQKTESIALKCPLCAKVSHVPEGGVLQLPANPVLEGLLEHTSSRKTNKSIAFQGRSDPKQPCVMMRTTPGAEVDDTFSSYKEELKNMRSERTRIDDVLHDFRFGAQDDLA